MVSVPIIAILEDINEDGLITILSEPKNALIKQYQKLFALEGVLLHFTPEALREVAKAALSRKSGARGLRSVLENAMLDVMYSVPFLEDIDTCTITKEVIDGTGDAILTFERKKTELRDQTSRGRSKSCCGLIPGQLRWLACLEYQRGP